MQKKYSKQVQMVLKILKDEIAGDITSALKKVTKDYTMTWVHQTPKRKELFPTDTMHNEQSTEEIYEIKGRQYDIKNIAEGKNVVMIEMVESYPDPDTKEIYRTPLVIVLEMHRGKIRTGRHYCDPNLSYLYLNKRQIEKAYKKSKGSQIILK